MVEDTMEDTLEDTMENTLEETLGEVENGTLLANRGNVNKSIKT
jgi:hypothetical protein